MQGNKKEILWMRARKHYVTLFHVDVIAYPCSKLYTTMINMDEFPWSWNVISVTIKLGNKGLGYDFAEFAIVYARQ